MKTVWILSTGYLMENSVILAVYDKKPTLDDLGDLCNGADIKELYLDGSHYRSTTEQIWDLGEMIITEVK